MGYVEVVIDIITCYSRASNILHSSPRTSSYRLNSDIHRKLLTKEHPFGNVIISFKSINSISDRSTTKTGVKKSGKIVLRNISYMTVEIVTEKLVFGISSPIELETRTLKRNETFRIYPNLSIKVLNRDRSIILVSDKNRRPPYINDVRNSFLKVNKLLTKEILENIINIADLLRNRDF